MAGLWTEDITEDLDDTPITILKAYADRLGKALSNRVTAEVHRWSNAPLTEVGENATDAIAQLTAPRKIRPKLGPKFYYTFEIVAPPLDNYRYELLVISFDVQMYPAKLYLDEDILHEIEPDLDNEYYGPLTIKDSEEMESMLNLIFNTKKTRTIIRALLSQMNGHYKNGVNN